jgi:hypothetical protein
MILRILGDQNSILNHILMAWTCGPKAYILYELVYVWLQN